MIDWRRMLQEKRSLVLPLAVAAVVNVGVYLLAVYPLTARTASVEARAQAASVALANAIGEFNAAEATLLRRDSAARLRRGPPHHLPATGEAGRGRKPRLRPAQLRHQAGSRERARAARWLDDADR
jgi:hypothetical protein